MAAGFDWKKYFLFSKRFWLLIVPIAAEIIVRVGVRIHVIPAGAEAIANNDVTEFILRGLEALGAYYVISGGPALTLSYRESGGVPEAPFHRLTQ